MGIARLGDARLWDARLWEMPAYKMSAYRPETTPAAPPQQQTSGGAQEAQGADTGVGTGAGAANDTRKNSRARKPNGVIEV
jgi:hypothetical protein